MRVLYISYFYPPLGGPAALRNVKTVKYLAEAGITCDVLTVGDIEYLYRDESLLEECREDKLIRTGSLDPMALLGKAKKGGQQQATQLYLKTPERWKLLIRRLFPIDNKIGWVPALIKAGKTALASAEYDLIFVSLGPFSSALGAYHLVKNSGLPLVLDLRDYWNLLNDYELQGTLLHRAFSRHWEKKVYKFASLIVTATQGIGTDAAKAYGAELADKMITIYNGWDKEDFADTLPVEKAPGFELAYFGNIYARRSLRAFYQAMLRLRNERLLPENTRIKLYGNFFREALKEIENSGISDIVEIIPQLEHRDALARMRASDVLLLTVNSSAPRGTLTSKVFEYLRSQRPILAMVPVKGEAAELLRAYGQEFICPMESVDGIYHCLKRLLASEPKNYSIPEDLERSVQVGKLAERLKSLP
jgi:hypothetical protein